MVEEITIGLMLWTSLMLTIVLIIEYLETYTSKSKTRSKGRGERMKHNCENWIESGVCVKCRRPEETLGKPNPFKVGDVVKIWGQPDFTYRGKKVKIVRQFADGSFKVEFMTGPDRTMQIERYDWWELKKAEER